MVILSFRIKKEVINYKTCQSALGARKLLSPQSIACTKSSHNISSNPVHPLDLNIMTTNHRPTLESKRGRDIAIKNTIQHARSGQGQTSLKLRLDVVGAKVNHSHGRNALDELVRELKRPKLINGRKGINEALLEVSEETDSTDVNMSHPSELPRATVQTHDDLANSDRTDEKEHQLRDTLKDAEDTNPCKNAIDLEAEESSGDLTSLDSEDDAEALMSELNKVRKEKAERFEERDLSAECPSVALNGTDRITKKSWRGSSAFSRANKPSDSFTTDTLRSDTHKLFLNKYFR